MECGKGVIFLYLSNITSKFLNAVIKAYRKRLKNNNANSILFRSNFLEIKEFKRFSKEEAEFCLRELDAKNLIRRYTDGGFAVTPDTVAYYDNQKRQPFLRVIWFVFGAVFTAFLNIVVALILKLVESV